MWNSSGRCSLYSRPLLLAMGLRGSSSIRWMILAQNGQTLMCLYSIQGIGGLPANYLTWITILRPEVCLNWEHPLILLSKWHWKHGLHGLKKRLRFKKSTSSSVHMSHLIGGAQIKRYVNFHIYRGSNQKVCEVTERPTTEAKGTDRSEFGDILAEVVANMSVPITILNVTLMGAFRSDAHIGIWSHPSTILDCSHWCLPGVPDAWNELVFSVGVGWLADR